MTEANTSKRIAHYKFHHIDLNKCRHCKTFDCEEACFYGIYRVINRDLEPQCTVIPEKEDKCIKCHICTSKCKYEAIQID